MISKGFALFPERMIIMELIVIDEDKIKIMLSAEDMKEYSLDCDKMDYGDADTRKAFRSILDEAKHRAGFDTTPGKVLVQVYPSKAGGCEMFITRLENNNEDDGETEVREAAIFGFDNINDLILLCRRLCMSGRGGDADVYYGDGGWFLRLNSDTDCLFVSDFGTRMGDIYSAYIHEYCTCICSADAIEKLSALA